ncbi:MAG: replication-relaxation family protein [Actinomycetota bacterium]
MSRRRVSPRELEQLRDDVTERDRAVLETAYAFRLVSGRQLRRLYFPGGETEARACRRVLARLYRWGALRRLDRRVGGLRAGSDGFVYTIGSVGERLLSAERPRRRLTEPSSAFVAHTLDVTEFYVTLVEAIEVTDHGDVIDYQTEPACWRDFSGIGGRQVLRPDLYVSIGLGELEHRWFIEVDRGTEHLPAIMRKSTTYDRYYRLGIEQTKHGNFPRVLWATTSERRADAMLRTLDASSLTRGLFRVVTLEHAVDALVGERP